MSVYRTIGPLVHNCMHSQNSFILFEEKVNNVRLAYEINQNVIFGKKIRTY